MEVGAKCGTVQERAWPMRHASHQAMMRKPTSYEFEILMPRQTQELIETVMEQLGRRDFHAAGLWLDAFRTEKNMGTSINAFYHCLIHACAKMGDVTSGAWCAARMMQTGLKPNQVTFNSLIEATGAMGDVEGAMYWAKEMLKHGVQPNGMTYNLVISICCQFQQFLAAEKWMNSLLSDRRIAPSITVFRNLIEGFSEMGNLHKAEKWFSKLIATGLKADVAILNALIDASAKSDDGESAEKWFASMVEAGLRPDERSFNHLIIAVANAGALEKAELWFSHMVVSGFHPRPVTYDAIVHACAKFGDAARVAHWTEESRLFGHVPTSPISSGKHVRRQHQRLDNVSACVPLAPPPGLEQSIGAPPGLEPPAWIICGGS